MEKKNVATIIVILLAIGVLYVVYKLVQTKIVWIIIGILIAFIIIKGLLAKAER